MMSSYLCEGAADRSISENLCCLSPVELEVRETVGLWWWETGDMVGMVEDLTGLLTLPPCLPCQVACSSLSASCCSRLLLRLRDLWWDLWWWWDLPCLTSIQSRPLNMMTSYLCCFLVSLGIVSSTLIRPPSCLVLKGLKLFSYH